MGRPSIARPNGWRVSGERRAEGDERVRCTRVLGRCALSANSLTAWTRWSPHYIRRSSASSAPRQSSPVALIPSIGSPWYAVICENGTGRQ